LVAEALRRHPQVNATHQNGETRLEPRINVGIAVATDQALVVPVVHDAADRTLEQIVSRRLNRSWARLARDGCGRPISRAAPSPSRTSGCTASTRLTPS
jgi:pyruvate dehydrogenase E2 component (dihydrolipoamide acetyltransferase)